MHKTQGGFTLIELVIVIVILGLLAATALPRFVNLTSEARLASVNGVAGGLRSGVSLVKAHVLVKGSSGGFISMDGVSVAVNASSFPTAAPGGIVAAMQGLDGYNTSCAGTTCTFRPTNGGSATCGATYDDTTGTVTVASAGC
jgi:MSHA pilin protein MshA